jgi:hypothetical protein
MVTQDIRNSKHDKPLIIIIGVEYLVYSSSQLIIAIKNIVVGDSESRLIQSSLLIRHQLRIDLIILLDSVTVLDRI